MNEFWLHVEGRIGASKPFAIIVGILVLVFGVNSLDNLNKAFTNLSGAQQVSVSQLAGNEIGPKHYVTVSGIAAYELSYQEQNNGVTVSIVFPLIDDSSHAVIFVRTTQTALMSQKDQPLTVTGMTESAPSELQSAITKDLADINTAGYQTTTTLYILQDEKPGDPIFAALQVAGLGFLLAVCVTTLFFPSTVFKAQPLPPVEQQPATGPDRVTATGTFSRLKSISPTLEFSRGTRKFENSVANILILEERWLALYIRFVMTYRVYGIPVNRNTSDWAVIIKPADVLTIEPGKIYSWRDRWAVSIRYRAANGKEETIIVSFNNANAQVKFVNFLREKSYPISFLYASTTPTWS